MFYNIKINRNIYGNNPRNYWMVLKNRLRKEGNESVANCNQLKLPSSVNDLR